jgi:hypothetical protein
MTLPFNLAADTSALPRPAKNLLALIGDTPIIEVNRMGSNHGCRRRGRRARL